MQNATPPTDQRARARPIAFALERMGGIGTPITLNIRPEDLTRTEPSRIAVHQTLGKQITGWVDNFGAGLPSVNISGHTGWRASAMTGEDGVKAFESLNKLVHADYHEAKQQAIDAGIDPSTVKLIFIDMLDGFTWNVAPMSFVLRRSKSRPLLMQYNIQLQAVSTSVDTAFMALPFASNLPAGLRALFAAIDRLKGIAIFIRQTVGRVMSVIGTVVATKNVVLGQLDGIVKTFVDMSTYVFTVTGSSINGSINGGSLSLGASGSTASGSISAAAALSAARDLSTTAAGLAEVGLNTFRSLALTEGITQRDKWELCRAASAYNEIVCLFTNSLDVGGAYQDYDPLFGASNCSSTTGGRQSSRFLDQNTFAALQNQKGAIVMSSAAQAAVLTVTGNDPIRAPLSPAELQRNLDIINSGAVINPQAVIL